MKLLQLVEFCSTSSFTLFRQEGKKRCLRGGSQECQSISREGKTLGRNWKRRKLEQKQSGGKEGQGYASYAEKRESCQRTTEQRNSSLIFSRTQNWFVLSWAGSGLTVFFLSLLLLSVQDKDGVLDPVAIPRFIPEITIGGAEYDKIYYEFRSVSNPGKGALVQQPNNSPCKTVSAFTTVLCTAWVLISCTQMHISKSEFWILPGSLPFLKSNFYIRGVVTQMVW